MDKKRRPLTVGRMSSHNGPTGTGRVSPLYESSRVSEHVRLACKDSKAVVRGPHEDRKGRGALTGSVCYSTCRAKSWASAVGSHPSPRRRGDQLTQPTGEEPMRPTTVSAA